MKPQANDREVTVGGAIEGASFGISKADEAHIMSILRDQMYSDKILAVLREYSANAWDANRSAGRGDQPVQVHLPEPSDLYLRIRDRGPGLSREDVLQVYTQYGASTKRGTNDAVGMLGIGSKSAFSYADSFMVTSWHGGTKSTYVAALDPSDKGVINLLCEEACAPEDTGVEVTVAVKAEDVYDFECRARVLYSHFEPRPEVNCELPEPPDERLALTAGSIDAERRGGEGAGGGQWVAVMGCVPYRIRLQELALPPEHRCLKKLSGVLRFEIGDVQISASREELRYTQKTKDALLTRFAALVDEYVEKALEILDSDAETWWQKRLRVQVLRELDLELPDQYEDLGKSWCKLFDAEELFTVVRNESATNQVTIAPGTRFLVDDTGKKLAGYRLEHDDYVVRGRAPGVKYVPTAEDVAALEARLAEVLEACRLTGAKVERLSTLHWTAPYQRPSRSTAGRAKHKASMFRFVPGTGYGKPYSDHWEVVSRVPEATDVFVVLDRFECGDFYQKYREDKQLAEAFNVELPEVYGYKTTEKKPVVAGNVTGTEYRVWRGGFAKSLMTPERAALVQATYWEGVEGVGSTSRQQLDAVVKALGRRHPVTQLIARARRAARVLRGKPKNALQILGGLCGVTSDTSEAAIERLALVGRYPLMQLHAEDQYDGSALSLLWQWSDKNARKRDAWVAYVKMCDQLLAAEAAKQKKEEDRAATATVHAN